jgi:hypothetical protein
MTPLWGMARLSRAIHPSARRVARFLILGSPHFMYFSTLRLCSSKLRAKAWLRASLATK